MTTFIINPGTGPCHGALLRSAWSNIRAFRRDLLYPRSVSIRPIHGGGDGGRYPFCLSSGRTVEVLMPGLVLSAVRFVGTGGQNIWDFPRLYIDGSSWVWKYAVSAANDILFGDRGC